MDGSISTPSDRLQFMIDAATNGPWGLGRYTTQSVEGPDQRGICSTGGFNASWIDSEVLLLENEANARLIAAAPDLAAEVIRLRAAKIALVAGQAKAYQQGLDDAAKALPSMVAPLVWVKRRNCQIWESNNYFVAEQVTRLHDKNRGFGMFLNYKKQSSHNTLEGAQNAANAHNADRSVAKAIAAVTVGGA